jgi:hypothetical protein
MSSPNCPYAEKCISQGLKCESCKHNPTEDHYQPKEPYIPYIPYYPWYISTYFYPFIYPNWNEPYCSDTVSYDYQT